ncbi:hypothetical protein Tco_1555231 [Tanacetum coccineum]
MACSLPHTVDEIHALVQKLIHEDSVRQKAMMDLAVQFDNASAAKHDLRQAYEKCNDIPQETRTLIDTFLKQESDKDYEMNLAINPFTPEKPTEAIPHQPYTTPKHDSETHNGGSSSEQHTHKPTSPITHGFLTEKEYQQLLQDEEVLRESLKEQARAKKEWDDRIKKEEAERELFISEFGVQSDSEYETD